MSLCGCQLDRRSLLTLGGLVLATPTLATALDPERAYAVGSGVGVPLHLELVTLTETSVILTWFTGDPTDLDEYRRPRPVPMDTQVRLGTSPDRLELVVDRNDMTPYHYAEVTGLQPGTTYWFQALSGGLPAAFTPEQLGGPGGSTATPVSFTTPLPPAGHHLFTVALVNDLHLGESVAGLAYSNGALPGGGLPPGFAVDPGNPYPEFMGRAAVAEARSRGADVLLAAGDLSSEGKAQDLATARGILAGFGAYGSDWFVTRGNHDRPHAGSTCTPSRYDGTLQDCFGDAFFTGRRSWFSHDLGGLHLVGLDTYDTTGNGSGNGTIGAEQWAWLTSDLAAHKDAPTIVFGHHPVSLESNVTTVEPLVFDLDPQQAQQLESLYARSPGVFLHHAGHTHRNKRTVGLTATGVHFQEVSATKEYPGGFTLIRVHAGGYAMNYYKTSDPQSREWSERTRGEDLGLTPFYTLGGLGDRNAVVAKDFSGLRALGAPAPPSVSGKHPAVRTSKAPAGAPALHGPSGALAATGGSPALPAAGLVAVAAAVRTYAARSRAPLSPDPPTS